MLRLFACGLLAIGSMGVIAESTEAGIFGRHGRPARTYNSRSYTPRSYNYRAPSSSRSSGPYVVRGQSPIPVHVSPARYRYLKTFYPNQVRDVR